MNGAAFGPDLSLTPDQEGLLRTALFSNSPNTKSSESFSNRISNPARPNSDFKQVNNSGGSMVTSSNMYTSPIQDTPSSGQLGSLDESPFLDYDLDDGNFDWDNSGDQLFGDIPGTEFNDEGEQHDKRKASNEDEEEGEGSSKRREGDDKSAKKPGRKPLTGEPTTKRKAQNRAAQRAFRERKERHLKDLETKVEDLEKSSETTNHENGRLRAQVEKLNTELKEYRKRLSLNTTGASHSPPQSATPSRNYYNGGNDFQFAFPKFGDLPGSFMSNGSITKTTSPTPIGQRSTAASNPNIAGMVRKESSGSVSAKSPTSTNGTFTSPLGTSRPYQASINGSNNTSNKSTTSFDELNGLFSPSILQNASRSNSADYVSYPGSKVTSTTSGVKQGSFSNADSQSRMPNVHRGSSTSITGSPASSMSHNGLDSSCGTTPESSAESPRKSSEATLNTINEEMGSLNKSEFPSTAMKSPAADINGIDWMAQQNGGQFDPVLFGDYRDPQDNILSSNFGDFFNDAFPMNDFGSPYNTGDLASPAAPKKDLMKEVEVQQNGNDPVVPEGEAKQFLTCDKLWDRVQGSMKAQSGEADMDELCTQLKSKAKCSGSGAVIEQKHVDAILGPAPEDQTDFLKMFS